MACLLGSGFLRWHLDPEIFLIDEILMVGDIEFQKKYIAKMKGFKNMGVPMIFVHTLC